MHFHLDLFSIFNFYPLLLFFKVCFSFPRLYFCTFIVLPLCSSYMLFFFFLILLVMFFSFFVFFFCFVFVCLFCFSKVCPPWYGLVSPHPPFTPGPIPRAAPLLPALGGAGEAPVGFIRGWSCGWLCWSGESLCSPSGYSCELGGSCYPCRSCRWRWAWWRPSGGPC